MSNQSTRKIVATIIPVLFILLIPACMGPDIDREITSTGIVIGVDNVSFARRSAQHDALVAASKQLTPDAVRFEYRVYDGVSVISLKVSELTMRGTYVSFSRVKNGWLAHARATRTEDDVAAIAALEYHKAKARVSHENLRTAYRTAEFRAVKTALVDSLKLPADFSGKIRGSMTIADMDVAFPEDAVEVTVFANLKEKSREVLSLEEKKALLDYSIKEHSSLIEWADALDTLTKLEALLEEPSVALKVRKANIQLELDSVLEAANSFAEAYTLAPDKHDLQDQQLMVLKKIPEENQNQEVKDAISRIVNDIAERKKRAQEETESTDSANSK